MRRQRRLNKLLSVLLAMAMVASMLPMSVFAAETEGDGTSETVSETTTVASMDDLLEAVKTAGSTITVSEVLTVAAGTEVYLDLNGCTVNMGENYIDNQGTLVVTGGTLIADKFNDPTNGAPILSTGNLTVNDATVTGLLVAIRVEGGFATIDSGNISVTGQEETTCSLVRLKGGALTIKGGTFTGCLDVAESCSIVNASGTASGAATAVIKGGSYSNFAGQPGAMFPGDYASTIVSVSGGTFDPAETDNHTLAQCLDAYLVDGYEVNDAGEVVKSALTLDKFVEAVVAGSGTYDGEGITVQVTPASGDARTETTAGLPNRLQKYSNPETYYAQYQRFADLTNVSISNVNFVFVPAAVTVIDAWNTSRNTTTTENINGELQLMNTGSVTLTGCTFDKMAVSPINAASVSVSGCTFEDLGAYAIKDITASTVSVTGTTFTNCNGGFWMDAAPTTLTVTGNIFTGVGRRGAIQFSTNGDYTNTTMTVTGNTVTGGAFLWQLNSTVTCAQVSAILDTTKNTYTTAYVSGSIEPEAPTYAAYIDGQGYPELQDAIDAATETAGTYTITLAAGTNDEDITIHQTEGVNITIQGAEGAVFTGHIEVYGHCRNDGEETLTFDGVAFATSESGHVFIEQTEQTGQTNSLAKCYPHNVTVQNCTFTATDAAVNSACGMKFRYGYDIKVTGTTSTGQHSLMQCYACQGVTIEDVDISGKNGIALGTSQNVSVSEANITATGYGLRVDAANDTTITIADCTVSANIPVVVRNATADVELVFTGDNTMEPSNSDGVWCAIGQSEYPDASLENLGAATGEITVTLNDTDLSADGVYGAYEESYAATVTDASGAVTSHETVKEALVYANSISGGTIDLLETAYEYAAPQTNDADMVTITNPGTYTITGGAGALLNYEVEVNPNKAEGEFIVNITDAHLTMTKLTLRKNATMNVTDSRVDYNLFQGGSAYLSVYTNSVLNVKGSTIGFDPYRTGVSDPAAYTFVGGQNGDSFGPRWSIYGTANIENSKLYVYVGQADGTAFDVLGNANVTLTDSWMSCPRINVGTAHASKYLVDSNATDLSAVLTLNNTTIENYQYRGDANSDTVLNGIYVGNGTNKGTLNINASTVDFTKRLYNDDREDGLSVTSTGAVNISASTVKVPAAANAGTVYVTGTSDIASTAAVTGSGWFYMDGVTMSKTTNLVGAKVGFINGTNTIVGSTIDDGWFNVGIGKGTDATAAAKFAAAKDITLGNVVVNVSGDAVIGAGGDTYQGWVGSAYSADKTVNTYALNIEESLASFGYLHVSKDGTLNVKGHATNKYTDGSSSVDFYAGDFIVNGTVTFDGTDAWAKFTKIAADHADAVLNVKNGATYEASIHNGAVTGTALTVGYNYAGTMNVDGGTLEIDNETIIKNGGTLNVTAAENAVVAKGIVTNNATITVKATGFTGKVMDLNQTEALTGVTLDGTGYNLVLADDGDVSLSSLAAITYSMTVGVNTVTKTDTYTNVEYLLRDLKNLCTMGTVLTGVVVELNGDITLSEPMVISNTAASDGTVYDIPVTFNGNGSTITYTGKDRAVTVESTAVGMDLTINDLTVVAENAQRGINYNTTGTLTLNDVSVTAGTYAVNLPGSSDGAEVTINDSDLTACIALNIWGADMTIKVTDTDLTSVDEAAGESYAAIQLNRDGDIVADGTTVTVTGGSITALDENGEWSAAVSNWTSTGAVVVTNATDSTADDYTAITGEWSVIVATVGGYGFSTVEGAIKYAAKNNNSLPVVLCADVALTAPVIVADGQTVTLDLNGHTISAAEGFAPAAWAVVAVERGGTLTINDTEGTGGIDAKDNVYAAVMVTTKNDTNTAGTATLTVNGGTLTGKWYAVAGNGSRPNTSITIAGGKLTSTEAYGLGIFHPQAGTLTITGGEIEAATGVEMRSGTLNMTGGTITATGAFQTFQSDSGSTVVGAAVALSQHTTNNPITIRITDGELAVTQEGAYAFYQDRLTTTYVASTGISASIGADIIVSGSVEAAEEGFEMPASDNGSYTLEQVEPGMYEVSDYKSGDTYTAPTQDGYVFAGWYTDSTCKTVYTATSGKAYAKFVAKEVLSVKAQITAGTTAESTSTDMRFITTVDCADYQEIGFKITIGEKTVTVTSKTVYKQIVAKDGGIAVSIAPTAFHETSKYFMTYTLTGIPQSIFDTDIVVVPYWVTKDGTEVDGVSNTLRVSMGYSK